MKVGYTFSRRDTIFPTRGVVLIVGRFSFGLDAEVMPMGMETERRVAHARDIMYEVCL